jgi:hypothetical protein
MDAEQTRGLVLECDGARAATRDLQAELEDLQKLLPGVG